MKKFIVGLAAFSMIFGTGTGVATAQGQQQQPPPMSEQHPQQAQQYPEANPYPQTNQQAGPPPQADGAQTSDSAAPGVARLSFVSGDVSTQTGDSTDWAAATQNTPVSVNDRVATANNGRAEIQLDAANDLRMSASATAKIASLDRTNIQVQVGQGLVTYSVLRGSEANSEIDTPNASIHPNGPGEYRILVNSDAETQVVVRQGSADVSTPQGSANVAAGQMITIAGTDNPQYKTEAAPGKDEWDSWNDTRDKRIQNASSWGKTDRYYTGSEDLDANGTWTEVPDYGQVWVPSQQDPNWAPYRDGRWVYQPYYGWTWVSYEPWGWAPYHYGRWMVYGGGWAWWPGPVYGSPGYYPVWAPAYVSFFGFGGGGFGFGFGFGFGGGFGRYGWLPIGPGDRYHPWYGGWGARGNFSNVSNFRNDHEGFAPLGGNRGQQFSNINEAMRNDRVRGGISSMGGSEFGRGAVSARQEPISESSFRQASVISGKMPVSPSRESFSPSGRSASPSAVRNATPASQHFFTGSARTNAGANGGNNGANNAGRNQPSFEGNRNAGGAAAINSNHMNGAVGSQSNRQAWHTFTPPQSANTSRSTQGGEQNSRGLNNNPSGNSGNSNRETFSSPSRQTSPSTQGDRGNWQHFTPPSSRPAQTQQMERGGSSQPQQQNERGGYPQSQQQYERGGASQSRQQLNMRQPVVTPHQTYSPPRQATNAPRGGGSNAPRGNSGSGGGSHGGGGGGHSSGHSR
jgi:ferric-dicitrate binding protein FerR (iron transport regulator)